MIGENPTAAQQGKANLAAGNRGVGVHEMILESVLGKP
jgi:hypothetical protein